MITLHVNGQAQTFDGDPSMPVLWYLRDVLGLTGTKFGCGVAACGACTIHLDGDATRSCQTPMSDANGKSVTTIEGLDPQGNHPRSEGLARAQRAAVRLLPGRTDHAGRRASEADASSDRRRHRQHDVRQHLPLRDLSAHSRRHQASCGSVIMTQHIREIAPASGIENVSRRGVLKGILATGGLVLAVHSAVGPALADDAPKWGADGMPHGTVNNPLAFVSIAPDGIVTIVCHRSEMGQGMRTGMPLIVADEMDADWARVKVAQAHRRREQIRQPGHRRLALDPPFLHADAPGRRRGAHDARGRRRQTLGRRRLRRRGEEPRGHSEVDRQEARLWRTRRRREHDGRAIERQPEKTAPRRLSACRSRTPPSSATSARKGPTSSTASTSRPAAPFTVRMCACPA